jgi:hypothetical protein
MNYDERIYGLVNPHDKHIAAVGVRLLDRADYLVGIYCFWDSFSNPRQFLQDTVRDFGEARLYAMAKNSAPGLVCKMSIDVPHLIQLPDDGLRLDLLEMRASNPKPFLALRYDTAKRAWGARPLLALRCIDSAYSYVPN